MHLLIWSSCFVQGKRFSCNKFLFHTLMAFLNSQFDINKSKGFKGKPSCVLMLPSISFQLDPGGLCFFSY